MNLDRWLALVGILAGTIGSVIGWIGLRSKAKRRPVYSISPQRFHLIDMSTPAAGLEIFHNKEPLAGRNVTAVTVYFANEGTAAIIRSDIFQPYRIILADQGRVLDATITSSRDVCRAAIEQKLHVDTGSEIHFSFDVLEPGDEIVFQIIYSGDPSAKINILGCCLDSASPELHSIQISIVGSFFYVLALAALSGFEAALLVIAALFDVVRANPASRSFALLLIASAALLGLAFISLIVILRRQPFEFVRVMPYPAFRPKARRGRFPPAESAAIDREPLKVAVRGR